MTATATELAHKHCVPCEGGVKPLGKDEVRDYLSKVGGWKLSDDGTRIRREWKMKDFAAALDFINDIGRIAEAEDHHPDLHLTGYRNLAVELSTHAIGGLSENDFILAARIDELTPDLK